jgi:hypothetical protein
MGNTLSRMGSEHGYADAAFTGLVFVPLRRVNKSHAKSSMGMDVLLPTVGSTHPTAAFVVSFHFFSHTFGI